MSHVIASAVIRGAHKIIGRAEGELKQAIEKYDLDQMVEFPNTAYYLPVVYAMTGMEVRTLADMVPVLDKAKSLLPPIPETEHWLPYLGNALDAGMATLFADEIIEVLKYLQDPLPYYISEECPETGPGFWLGAADDVIFRKRGLEFVDGTAPGFAACVGACPTNEIAVRIARELQAKNLYVFMTATTDGKNMAEQLREEGIQLGWETRLVPFGKDITATVFPLGFASRVAMSFGGIKPGDFRRNLLYNLKRTYAFVLALGEVDDEKYAQAAGAINFGFPTIADTDIPEILPSGICMYEHVVAMPKQVPAERIHEEIVAKAIEVRGLKVEVKEVPIPVPYGPAFEGERVRRDDMHVEFGGQFTPAFEHLSIRELSEIQDGHVEVHGPDVDDVEVGAQLPLGILVEVAGREMQPDFEPVMERMIHTYINGASGIFHHGQRDINWVRISKIAKESGFTVHHFGDILHARLHQEYGVIVDKVQVKVYTDEARVLELREVAREAYRERDARIAGMTDESVETLYSCILCQSFAPQHVCVITPERSGLCGGYTWLDAKANFQMIPTGPNQPIQKGFCLDETLGQWQGVNEYLYAASRGALSTFSAYSMIQDPMTSCVVSDTEVVIDGKTVRIGDFIDQHRGGDDYRNSSALTLREASAEHEPIVAMQRFPAPERLIQVTTKSGSRILCTPDHGLAVDRQGGVQWIPAEQLLARDRVVALKNPTAFEILDCRLQIADCKSQISNLQSKTSPLVSQSSSLLIVTDVKQVQNDGQYEHVYNLTLAETHCYFANGMLIKNCGCFECISAVLPLTNGIMIVNREYLGMTPCGMKFSTLAGAVGGGLQSPGFIGHSRQYIASPKFIRGDGGVARIVWMTKELKESVGPQLAVLAEQEGIENFPDLIADETIATTEEEVLDHLMAIGHPALTMDPMF